MILIKDIVKDTFSNSSGYSLYLELSEHLNKSDEVILLSFEDISSTSSSFLNSSIGVLVEARGFPILQRIKPVKVGTMQAELLKKYISSLKGLVNN
jgi:hypothetical protein